MTEFKERMATVLTNTQVVVIQPDDISIEIVPASLTVTCTIFPSAVARDESLRDMPQRVAAVQNACDALIAEIQRYGRNGWIGGQYLSSDASAAALAEALGVTLIAIGIPTSITEAFERSPPSPPPQLPPAQPPLPPYMPAPATPPTGALTFGVLTLLGIVFGGLGFLVALSALVYRFRGKLSAFTCADTARSLVRRMADARARRVKVDPSGRTIPRREAIYTTVTTIVEPTEGYADNEQNRSGAAVSAAVEVLAPATADESSSSHGLLADLLGPDLEVKGEASSRNCTTNASLMQALNVLSVPAPKRLAPTFASQLRPAANGGSCHAHQAVTAGPATEASMVSNIPMDGNVDSGSSSCDMLPHIPDAAPAPAPAPVGAAAATRDVGNEQQSNANMVSGSRMDPALLFAIRLRRNAAPTMPSRKAPSPPSEGLHDASQEAVQGSSCTSATSSTIVSELGSGCSQSAQRPHVHVSDTLRHLSSPSAAAFASAKFAQRLQARAQDCGSGPTRPSRVAPAMPPSTHQASHAANPSHLGSGRSTSKENDSSE